MHKITLLFFLLLLGTFALNAQTVEQSKSIDKNTLQLEFESIFATEKENSITTKSITIPNLLIRFGFTKKIELQVNLPLIKENQYENDKLIHSIQKFDDLSLGFNINLWQQKNVFPQASILYRKLLHQTKNLNFKTSGDFLSLNLENQISRNLTLSYNIAYSNEIESKAALIYVINLNTLISNKLNYFIEFFGNVTKNDKNPNNLNTGIGYTFNKNFIAEGFIATGLNHNQFFTGGRITWRFNTH